MASLRIFPYICRLKYVSTYNSFPVIGRIIAVFMLAILLSACQPLEDLKVRLGLKEAQEEKVEEQRGLAEPTGFIKSPKERRQMRKLFLSEIYEHVYARKFTDKESFIKWMNVLEQGASVEGVYRGLVLSREYAQMERGRTTAEALDLFASEMAILALFRDGKNAKYFDSEDGKKKLAGIKAALTAKFETRSLFTLKRVLGEEILAYIEVLKSNRESLVEWYAVTTVRWNGYGVDFGMEQRNKPDKQYHARWASGHSLGRIQWEVLNRLHRLFNRLGRILYAK